MMGVILVKSLQFIVVGIFMGIFVNVKYYFGDGGMVNGVNGGVMVGDEVVLCVIYFEFYWVVVVVYVGLIMVLYSIWQVIKMYVNKVMFIDIFKGEFGFGGFVILDFDVCFQFGLLNMFVGQQDGFG